MIAAAFVALTLAAATDGPIIARVIDSNSERVPTETIAPAYPRKARRDRVEGEVMICFDVDRSGRPRRVAVRRSSHRIFERPSLRAVKKSRFLPLERGEPLPLVKSCRTFIFALVPLADEEF